jgi:nicotinamide phosphoribosyltransferase
MIVTATNPLLGTDVYKCGHMEQYAPGTTKVYSYLTARSDKVFDSTVFFGLQALIEQYLTIPLTQEHAAEFLDNRRAILGPMSHDVEKKIRALCQLGYFPIEIKAVSEGTVMPVRNVLMTITNTHPDFYWAVGFVESLLLKVWYPITVASCCFKYRCLVERMYARTVDSAQFGLRDFAVHDFGYRGDATEEGAAISGAAHLLSFLGSDTVPARKFAQAFYDATEPIMLSVPASEHSVMCSFGREDELAAFENMLRVYPSGIVSIVSDTFDVYEVLTTFAEKLKPTILARDGKVVFRPDSGNPEHIICGDPEAESGSPASKGALRLLGMMFGSEVNSKGFRVLNPKVGLIYGDGMYFERYQRTLERMESMGYASSNLVIGVGGILRNHSRDTLGFAIKATYVEKNGAGLEIEKDPVTDHKKKSHKGLMRLLWDDVAGSFKTVDQCTEIEEDVSLLQTVYSDGQVMRRQNLQSIRRRVKAAAAKAPQATVSA